MENVSLELIILVIVVVLIVIAAVGIFMGSRISGDKKRIKELEEKLKDAEREMEAYRGDVNNHFKKTSDLFTKMTESYKAVYLHMVDGSQALCTSDAGLLKGSNSDFLKVVHDESGESPDEHAPEEDLVARDPDAGAEQPDLPAEEADAVVEPVAVESLEEIEVAAEELPVVEAEADVIAEDISGAVEEETAGETDPAESSEEKKDGLPADRSAG